MTGCVQQHRLHRVPPLGVFDETRAIVGPSERALAPDFSYYNNRVKIHGSARKHRADDEDILHAIDHGLAFEDVGEDPDRWLLIGPDTAGNLLEVVVMITTEGNQIVIHAMLVRINTEGS